MLASKSHHSSHGASVRHGSYIGVWYGVELSELWHTVFMKGDECTLVADLVTIVWCREHGNTLAIMHHLIPSIFNFVTADQKLQTIVLEKSLCHVRAELRSRASLARGSTLCAWQV